MKKKRSLQVYKARIPVISGSKRIQGEHVRKYDTHITLVNKGVSNVKIRPRIVPVIPRKELIRAPRSLIKLRPRGLVVYGRERLSLVSVPKPVLPATQVKVTKVEEVRVDFTDKDEFLVFFHRYDEEHDGILGYINQNQSLFDDMVWDEWESGESDYPRTLKGFIKFYDDHDEWTGSIWDGWGGGDQAGFYFYNHHASIKEKFARDVWDEAEVGEQNFITEYNMFHDPFDGMFMTQDSEKTFSGYDEKRYAIVATFGYPVFTENFADPVYRRENPREWEMFKKMKNSNIPFAWYIGGEVEREGAIFVPKEYEQRAKDLLKEGPSWHAVGGRRRKR